MTATLTCSPKRVRLDFLCQSLGLVKCPGDVHYQLLHRTVSALIEAEKFAANDAAMIVHSFSPDRKWFYAFERFVALLGAEIKPGEAVTIDSPGGKRLVLGWACGDLRHLEA